MPEHKASPARARDASDPVTGRRIRVGFLQIGDGQWRGGVNYQRTLLEIISGSLADRIEARVFVTEEQLSLASEAFSSALETPLIVDNRVVGAGTGQRALAALAIGRDRVLEAVMLEHGIDVVFETARFFGRRFALPVLSWMPDFQHRHLPEFFSRAAWWKRDIGFRAQAGGRRVIMLSSEDARRDCEHFYAGARGRTKVVHFAPKVPFEQVKHRAGRVRTDYGLPDRFFYMPNQFWAHKNHSLVIAALLHLKNTNRIEAMPPIVMSGSRDDHRNTRLFEKLMRKAEENALDSWFRHIGLIPFADVLALNAASEAVVNPSLFEGWASVVEEAKALGTPMILSDISVHREQASGARFFEPREERSLAEALYEAARTSSRSRPAETELGARHEIRRSEFAAALGDAILAAYRC